MNLRNKHILEVVIYVTLAAVVVASLLLYQRHNNSRFNRENKLSCENRKILSTNQRLVLSILERQANVLVAIAPTKENLSVLHQIDHGQQRLDDLPQCKA